MSAPRVAISGASGYLGQGLARRCVDSGASVLGFDLREPGENWPRRASFARQDVTEPSLAARLRAFRPDVLVHLAWVLNPSHSPRREREVDLRGTVNAFRAAVAAGVRRIVYPSSTTAYGLQPGRRRPYCEEDLPRPNPAFPYADCKAKIEQWLPGFRGCHPQLDLVVLRASIVVGPRVDNIVSTMVEGPVMIRVAGYDPPLQLLHEADAREVLWRAVVDAPAGVFNVAGGGVMLLSEIARAAGRTCLPVPAALLSPLVWLGWRARILPLPPGLLDYIRYPWVADTAKLEREFGFRPRYSTREALAAYLEVRASGRRSSRS
ncbi:MAG: NAD-dependent epimerase/dehydratase family protein [Acidobacteriota bacterium]